MITTVNRGMFQADDFQPAAGNDRPGGMVLAAGALREFFGAYERWMIGTPSPTPSPTAAAATTTTPAGSDGAAAAPLVRRTFRQALRREVESFAKVLRDGKGWEPFTFAAEPRAGEAVEEDADCGMSSLTI